MGCALLILGHIGPRIGNVVLWLFTDRMSRAYEHGIVPVIGFFVAPWTTFFYALAAGGGNGVRGLGTLLIGFGVLLDIFAVFGARREQRRRARSVA